MILRTKEINRSQRLFIELGTSLLLEPDKPERAVSSQLIGMQVGSYLIVQVAGYNWKRSMLKASEKVYAKYIQSDDVFGFRTRVVQALETPDFLLFLEYPDEVKSCNIRSEKRVECFLPVRLTLDTLCLKGVIININKSGCLCVVNDCPDMDEHPMESLVLDLPYGQYDNLFIDADIRSAREENNRTSFGLLFKNLEGYTKTVLSTLVPSLEI